MPRAAGWVAALGGCAAALLGSACIVDSDKPCDEGRVEITGSLSGCICAPGSVPNAESSACVPCGENEEPRDGACECVAGYERGKKGCVVAPDSGPEATDSSTPSEPTGQDTACTNQTDCAGFDADFCIPFPGAQFCAVRNCISGESTCTGDRVCCDVSAASAIFPDLTMADGICVTTAACAMGGTVVMP
jgi:hypothetical protein